MKYCIIIIIIISVLGCATTPPHRIENHRYFNPKHNLSMAVPDGWMTTTKSDTNEKYDIIFYNEDTNGLISIGFGSSLFKTGSMSQIETLNFLDYLGGAAEKKLRKVSINSAIKNIDYHYNQFPEITNQPECFFEFEILWDIQGSKINSIGRNFLYKCHQDYTCVIRLELSSSSETFELNKLIYENLIQSLNYEITAYDKNPPYIRNEIAKPFQTLIDNSKKKSFIQSNTNKNNAPFNEPDGGIEEKLTELKRLRDKGLITQEDYENKKNEYLNKY